MDDAQVEKLIAALNSAPKINELRDALSRVETHTNQTMQRVENSVKKDLEHATQMMEKSVTVIQTMFESQIEVATAPIRDLNPPLMQQLTALTERIDLLNTTPPLAEQVATIRQDLSLVKKKADAVDAKKWALIMTVVAAGVSVITSLITKALGG